MENSDLKNEKNKNQEESIEIILKHLDDSDIEQSKYNTNHINLTSKNIKWVSRTSNKLKQNISKTNESRLSIYSSGQKQSSDILPDLSIKFIKNQLSIEKYHMKKHLNQNTDKSIEKINLKQSKFPIILKNNFDTSQIKKNKRKTDI